MSNVSQKYITLVTSLGAFGAMPTVSKNSLRDRGKRYIGRIEGTDIGKKIQGRNEPCACGSGKKFKKCCINGPQVVAPQIDREAIEAEITELKEERISLLDKYGVFGGGREINEVFDRLNKRIDELEDSLNSSSVNS
jgi:hypothetical protein